MTTSRPVVTPTATATGNYSIIWPILMPANQLQSWTKKNQLRHHSSRQRDYKRQTCGRFHRHRYITFLQVLPPNLLVLYPLYQDPYSLRNLDLM